MPSHNSVIYSVRFSDGSLRNFKLSDAEQLAEVDPEYYTHAVSILAAKKRQELYDKGWSPVVIQSKIGTIHQKKLGTMISTFNTNWALNNADKNLESAKYQLYNAFLSNASPEAKAAIMTGVLASVKENFKDKAKFPGQERQWRKARLQWVVDRQNELMELMELQGKGELVNQFFANYKIPKPAYVKSKHAFVPLSEAHPEHFSELVLAEKLQEYRIKEANEAQQEQRGAAFKAVADWKDRYRRSKQEPGTEGYNDESLEKLMKDRKQIILQYGDVAQDIIKTLDDLPYTLLPADTSYSKLLQIKKSRDINGVGGYVTQQEIDGTGTGYVYHSSAVEKLKKKFGDQVVIQEEFSKGVEESFWTENVGVLKAQIKANSHGLSSVNPAQGALEKEAYLEAEKELEVRAKQLYEDDRDDEEHTKETAIEAVRRAMLLEMIQDDKLATKTNSADLGRPAGSYGKYGSGTVDGFPYFKNKGAPTLRRRSEIAQLKDDAQSFYDEHSGDPMGWAKPFTSVKYPGIMKTEDGVVTGNPQVFQNGPKGDLHSLWYHLAEVARKNGENSTALEIAEFNAKEYGVELEPPIDWDAAEKLRTKLNNNNNITVDPKNPNQFGRALQAAREIDPRVFKRSIGDFTIPWDQVPALAEAVGEKTPATKEELQNNPVLLNRLFWQYIKDAPENIKAKYNPKTYQQLIRMLAAHSYGIPIDQLMDLDANGDPLFRSSLNGMDIRTQNATDLFINGGLEVQF